MRLRRKSIIKSPAARRHLPSKKPLDVRTIRILHVEGNQAVVDAVRDMLESDGWNIETCADGTEKLKTIAGDTYYDLLLFDNSLPGINGLNLLQQVRRMPHRLHTPIVILLSDPIGDEGLRAGANAVLLKPETNNQ